VSKTLAFLPKTVYHIATQKATAPKSQGFRWIFLVFVQLVRKFPVFKEEVMLYHSTRGKSHTVDSAQAVLEGLAPDGGLYMPASLPAFDWKACLEGDSQAMATMILSALLPDIPDMKNLVQKAYTGKFETEDLTPTVPVGDFHVLELFRGPTSAFKDVALSMLPQLLTAAKTTKGME
jgi:threonine synthase